jgi:prepilin-type N-terminal cleavage/methylation domain-containing protein
MKHFSAIFKSNISSQKGPACRQAGFTLVELLVVIGVLGVLAAAVLTAINPLEQLARGRDGGRKSTVSQLGNSLQSYYTSQNAVYPTGNATWITTLVTAGELKSIPAVVTPGCAGTNAQNGWCYVANASDAIVFTPAESAAERTRAGCTTAQTTWIVWSSAAGKTGSTCTANATTYPAVGITTLQ